MSRSLVVVALLGAAVLSAACASSSSDATTGDDQNIEYIHCGGFANLQCPDGLVCDAPPGFDSMGFCKRPVEDQFVVPNAIDDKDLQLALTCTPKTKLDGGELVAGDPTSYDLLVRLSSAPTAPLEYVGEPDPGSQGSAPRYSNPYFQIRTGLKDASGKSYPEKLGFAVANAPMSSTATKLLWKVSSGPNVPLEATLQVLSSDRVKFTYRFEDRADAAAPRIIACEGVAQL
jgi:hypothetical protein